MKSSEPIDRREFTLAAALAALAGATIIVEGCGGGAESPTATAATGPPAPVEGTISANHGHRAVISSAQLQAGGDVSLDIQAEADHPHTVALSGAEVMSIRQGGQVSKNSSVTTEHMHVVTFQGRAPGTGEGY